MSIRNLRHCWSICRSAIARAGATKISTSESSAECADVGSPVPSLLGIISEGGGRSQPSGLRKTGHPVPSDYSEAQRRIVCGGRGLADLSGNQAERAMPATRTRADETPRVAAGAEDASMVAGGTETLGRHGRISPIASTGPGPLLIAGKPRPPRKYPLHGFLPWSAHARTALKRSPAIPDCERLVGRRLAWLQSVRCRVAAYRAERD